MKNIFKAIFCKPERIDYRNMIKVGPRENKKVLKRYSKIDIKKISYTVDVYMEYRLTISINKNFSEIEKLYSYSSRGVHHNIEFQIKQSDFDNIISNKMYDEMYDWADYYRDDNIRDGSGWELGLTFCDGNSVSYFGINAGPEKGEIFCVSKLTSICREIFINNNYNSLIDATIEAFYYNVKAVPRNVAVEFILEFLQNKRRSGLIMAFRDDEKPINTYDGDDLIHLYTSLDFINASDLFSLHLINPFYSKIFTFENQETRGIPISDMIIKSGKNLLIHACNPEKLLLISCEEFKKKLELQKE